MNPELLHSISETISRGVSQVALQVRQEAIMDITLTGVFFLITLGLGFLTWKFIKASQDADDCNREGFFFGCAIGSVILGAIMFITTMIYVGNLSKAISTLRHPEGAAIRLLFEGKGPSK